MFQRLPLILLLAHASLLAQMTVQKSAPDVQDLSQDQTKRVERLAKLQMNFGKKMNSPGVEATLKEIGREKNGDHTEIKYRLIVTGAPAKTTFNLIEVGMNGSTQVNLTGVTLDASGQAICAGTKGTCSGSGPDDPVSLIFVAAKSEPRRIAVVFDDTAHTKAFVQAIPFPNRATDKECTIESVLGLQKGVITYLQGSGFQPNEDLVIESESYGEKLHGTGKATPEGTYFAPMLPNVLGKESGETVARIKGKNCAPELKFSWGTYHYE